MYTHKFRKELLPYSLYVAPPLFFEKKMEERNKKESKEKIMLTIKLILAGRKMSCSGLIIYPDSNRCFGGFSLILMYGHTDTLTRSCEDAYKNEQ